MSSTVSPLPKYAQNLAVALVRRVAERDAFKQAYHQAVGELAAIRQAYHQALALLHEVTMERDLLRTDRNQVLEELSTLRRERGVAGVRSPRRGRAA